MNDERLIGRADMIARLAHQGQKRKDKTTEYYVHPKAVADALKEGGFPTQFVITALLHDVVEDTAMTLDDLINWEIPESIVEAVDAMSRRGDGAEKEPYLTYISRLAHNHIARRVKQFDIAHNLTDLKKHGSMPDKYHLAKFLLEHFDFDDFSPEDTP